MSLFSTSRAKSAPRRVALALVAALALASAAYATTTQTTGKGELAPGQAKKSFTISGDLAIQLSPGRAAPLDLSFDNPNNKQIEISEVVASIAGTTAPGCAASNFEVGQYSGSYPIPAPPGTSSLSAAVADSTKWPQVRMRNLPTNQDACKGATITLSYSASATK
jgi:hypothetical protein